MRARVCVRGEWMRSNINVGNDKRSPLQSAHFASCRLAPPPQSLQHYVCTCASDDDSGDRCAPLLQERNATTETQQRHCKAFITVLLLLAAQRGLHALGAKKSCLAGGHSRPFHSRCVLSLFRRRGVTHKTTQNRCAMACAALWKQRARTTTTTVLVLIP